MLKFRVKADGFDELQEAIARACTKAEHIVAIQVRKDTSPYVPFLTGSLAQTGSTYAPKGGTKVLTDKNLVFNMSGHSQAQSHWFEASKAENLDKWIRVADKAVKNGL